MSQTQGYDEIIPPSLVGNTNKNFKTYFFIYLLG